MSNNSSIVECIHYCGNIFIEPLLSSNGGTHQYTDWWEGFMKSATKMGAGDMIYIYTFHKDWFRHSKIHKQTAWWSHKSTLISSREGNYAKNRYFPLLHAQINNSETTAKTEMNTTYKCRIWDYHTNQCHGEYCLLLHDCSAYSLILKMEALCSSKMLVKFCQTVWHHIPDKCTLHSPHISYYYVYNNYRRVWIDKWIYWTLVSSNYK
jgi:hypothetical protein